MITRIIDYARKQKEKDESRAFYEACSIALKLAADTSKEPDYFSGGYGIIRNNIEGLLADLEVHVVGCPSVTPSPSLMIALLQYLTYNHDLLDTSRGLIDALRPTIGVGPHATTLSYRGHVTRLDIGRAQEQLRELFSPRPTQRRRNAMGPDTLPLRQDAGTLSPPTLCQSPAV